MGQVSEIQDDWSGGSKQDQGIEAVPANAAWKVTNMLPGLGGFALGLRGGFTYASCDVRGAVANLDQVFYGGWLTSSTGSPLYMSGASGRTVRVNPSSTASATALQQLPSATSQNGVEFNNQMIFTQSGSAPKYYTDSSSVYTSVSASAPSGTIAAVYKGRLVLANDGTNRTRVWFSGIYDTSSTTAWNTSSTGRWIDTSYNVTALAPMQNLLLVFSDGHIERIRGNTPGGGGQAGDIVLESLFDIGVNGPSRVTVAEDKCYFVNSTGVYMTDGANLTDLTEQGGMTRAWQAQNATQFSIGYASGWLFVLVGSTIGWMVNIQKRSWYALSFGASFGFNGSFVSIQDADDEVYGFKDGTIGASDVRPVALTPMLTQTSTHDADGSAIVGTLQTRSFLSSLRIKRYRRFFARYEVTDPGTANPAVTVEPNYDPIIAQGSSLSSGSTITFPETTDTTTGRGGMNKKARAVAFYIATSGKGYPVGIQQIGVEAHELEPTRLT